MLPEIFNFQQTPIRVVMQQGEPWWVANDVCRVLGIANPRSNLAQLDDDEKGVGLTDTLGGPQNLAIINESGLYSLVLSSRKPEAKAFKRWITHEVLPAIRKTGMYGAEQALNDPQWLRQALAQAMTQVSELQKELKENPRILPAPPSLPVTGRPPLKSARACVEIEKILEVGPCEAAEFQYWVMERAQCSRPTLFRALLRMGIRFKAGFYTLPPDYVRLTDQY